MTKKNIFVYKLFLSLNILDLNLFFMWKLQPSSPSLDKVTCLFPSNPPLKVQILSSPSFFEKLVGCLMPPPPPSQQKGGGSAHYVVPGVPMIMLLKVLKYFSSGKISFFLFATLWLQDFKQKKIYVFFPQKSQSHTTVTLNRKWVVIPRKNVGLYLEFVLLGS